MRKLILSALAFALFSFPAIVSARMDQQFGYATSSTPGVVKRGSTLSMSATGVLDVNNINGVSVTPTGGTADTVAGGWLI